MQTIVIRPAASAWLHAGDHRVRLGEYGCIERNFDAAFDAEMRLRFVRGFIAQRPAKTSS